MTVLSDKESALLSRIRGARRERRTLREGSDGLDLAGAYRVQEAQGEERIKGYKLGLISPAKQRQMLVDSPIYGRVYGSMLLESPVDLGRFIQPRIEPEVAVFLGDDLRPRATPGAAWRAIGAAFLAVDVLDSVWKDYRFGVADVVADNASGGGFLMAERPLTRPPKGDLRLYLDGELVAAGPLEALGDVAERLAWLSEAVGGLCRGEVVFLGSPAAASEARPGILELRGPQDSVLVARLDG